jgi:brefeldin A-resistance guanine nucleotide exchange factor 1
MACVVASEVATVLAVMRRNVRWAGVRYGGDDGGGGADDEHLDHPLIAGLKSLRRRAASWGGRWPAGHPLLYLRPFLDVVRSDETGAPITGAALSSLHKILSLDLVVPGPGAAEAMGAVVEAVTGCRFEVTDPASEEAVLARVLQVLLACVRGRAAPALANRHVCAIVSTCFRVVQQAGTKGELLQRVSRQTMQEVIRCIFGRLADIDVTANEQVGFASQGSSLLPPFLVLNMMIILLAVLM